MAHLAAEVECQARVMNYPHATMLDQAAIRDELASPVFHGALLDRHGGHLHPLNYTLGLAEAARRAGVQLYEESPAIAIAEGDKVVVRTAAGTVTARHVVLACDAFLGDLDRDLAGKIMPVANYIVATEKLADPSALISRDRAVSDTKFVVDYFPHERRWQAAVWRRRALYAGAPRRHRGIRAALHGGDLPAARRDADRAWLGRARLGHADPACRMSGGAARSSMRTAIQGSASC